MSKAVKLTKKRKKMGAELVFIVLLMAGGLLLIGGMRYVLMGDTMGAVINFVVVTVLIMAVCPYYHRYIV